MPPEFIRRQEADSLFSTVPSHSGPDSPRIEVMLDSFVIVFARAVDKNPEIAMLSRSLVLLTLIFLVAATSFGQQSDNQSSVVLDENLWITFYDLPSRRFRAIRSAILSRDFESAARDLSVTASYLSVEAERSSAVFQVPLRDVVDRLRRMQATVERVTLEELDVLFGRAHWLLAQHYLEFARQSRDARQNRNASLYLWATTHHIERAILWSNAAVTREVHATLEGLQELASELKNPETSARAYGERPIVRAEGLLRKMGKQIDRRVLLPPAQNDVSQPDAEY